MLKILHTGDIHLGSSENYGKINPKTGRNTRFEDIVNTLHFMVNYAIEEKIDLFVFAGDIFKTRNPSMTQQKAFAEIVKKITDSKIPVLIVAGNHDAPADSNKTNSIDMFDFMDPNLVKVSSRSELLEIAGIQVATLPWFTRSVFMTNTDTEGKSKEEINLLMSQKVEKMFQTMVSQADETKPLISVVHATVSGATFGAERSVMLGQDIVLPYQMFCDKKVSYAALGHIHRHQTVGKDHIVYSGSPERISFGESEEKKGFVIAEIEAGERAKWEQVKTPAREFIEQGLEVDESGKVIGENIDPEGISSNNPLWNNNCIRIIVNGSRTGLNSFDFQKFEEKVKKHEPFFYQIIKKVTREDREELSGDESFEELSPLELLDKFSEKKKLKAGEKKHLLSKGKEILDSLDTEKETHGSGAFIPQKISLKNFCSHEDSVLDFDKFSLAVLSGENGAGKSSLIESIFWVIWGESRAKSDDQLVRLGTVEMEVEIEFLIGNETFKIIRKRSIKGSRGSGTLELQTKNGNKWEVASGSTIKETQEKIISLVGMSAEVFSSSAYIRQGMSGQFTESNPGQRKEVLAEILSLGIWSEIEKISKEQKKELEGKKISFETKKETFEDIILEEEERKKTKEEKEKESKILSEEIKKEREELEEMSGSIKNVTVVKTTREIYLKRIEDEKKATKERELEKEEIEKSLNAIEKIMENEDKIRDAEKKYEKIQKDILDLEKLKESYVSSKNEKEKNEIVKKNIVSNIERIQKDIEDNKKRGIEMKEKIQSAGTDCPTCGTEKTHQKRNPHEDLNLERGKMLKSYFSFTEELKKKEEELKKIPSVEVPVYSENMLIEAKSKLSDLQTLIDLIPRLNSASERTKELEDQKGKIFRSDLKSTITIEDSEEILKKNPPVDNYLIEKIESTKKSIEAKDNSLNYSKSFLAIAESKLKEIEEAKKSLIELETENKENIQKYSALEILIEASGKKGVQAMIIDTIIPEIEIESNQILQKISNGSMSVRFSTTREKKSATKKEIEISGSQIETLDIYVEDEEGEREYEMFSGGEAFRVNFAIRIALSKILSRRTGTQIKFLMIDEGFGSLDDDGKSAFISSIQKISDDFSKVIAVTHVDEIRDSFDTKILIEKIDRSSHISFIS